MNPRETPYQWRAFWENESRLRRMKQIASDTMMVISIHLIAAAILLKWF